MLKDINLDTDQFEDMVEQAKKKISVLYPQWTDYNYHDPGITIIELFAWLKEIQHYYMNQFCDRNKDIFYMLLGIKERHKKPAMARLEVSVQNNRKLPVNTKFYAGDLVFETTEPKTVLAKNISRLVIETEDGIRTVSCSAKEGHVLKEYPFGESVKNGNALYLVFDQPLPIETDLTIFFNILEGSPVERNPVGDFTFVPLAKHSFAYYSEEGCLTLPVIQDTTYGFIQDGSISFALKKEMQKMKIHGDEGFFIKVTVLEQEYDIPPLLSGISINMITAKQQETILDYRDIKVTEVKIIENQMLVTDETAISLQEGVKLFTEHEAVFTEAAFHMTADEDGICTYVIPIEETHRPDRIRIVYHWTNTWLGHGTGFANQKIIAAEKWNKDFTYEDFELMVSEKSGDGTTYISWQKVSSFYHSGPADCHYRFDEVSGEVLFGDGVFGSCPNGDIHCIGLKKTKGSKGNVKSDTIKKGPDGIFVTNVEPAFGGSDGETGEETLNRFHRRLRTGKRLVTKEDYERLVMETPGLIVHNCKVMEQIKEPNVVEIAIKPYSLKEESYLGKSYESNILKFLEEQRLVGTKIKLISPEYVRIELYADIFLKPEYRDAKNEIEQMITEYFRERSEKFGTPVLYSRIFALLSSAHAVVGVSGLVLRTENEKVDVTAQGDLILPANAIALQGEIQFLYRT